MMMITSNNNTNTSSSSSHYKINHSPNGGGGVNKVELIKTREARQAHLLKLALYCYNVLDAIATTVAAESPECTKLPAELVFTQVVSLPSPQPHHHHTAAVAAAVVTDEQGDNEDTTAETALLQPGFIFHICQSFQNVLKIWIPELAGFRLVPFDSYELQWFEDAMFKLMVSSALHTFFDSVGKSWWPPMNPYEMQRQPGGIQFYVWPDAKVGFYDQELADTVRYWYYPIAKAAHTPASKFLIRVQPQLQLQLNSLSAATKVIAATSSGKSNNNNNITTAAVAPPLLPPTQQLATRNRAVSDPWDVG